MLVGLSKAMRLQVTGAKRANLGSVALLRTQGWKGRGSTSYGAGVMEPRNKDSQLFEKTPGFKLKNYTTTHSPYFFLHPFQSRFHS